MLSLRRDQNQHFLAVFVGVKWEYKLLSFLIVFGSFSVPASPEWTPSLDIVWFCVTPLQLERKNEFEGQVSQFYQFPPLLSCCPKCKGELCVTESCWLLECSGIQAANVILTIIHPQWKNKEKNNFWAGRQWSFLGRCGCEIFWWVVPGKEGPKLLCHPFVLVFQTSFFLFSHPLGTEPWYFYFINGFLNFNVVFVLALLVLPLTCLMECLLQKFRGECRAAGRVCLPKSSFSFLEVKLGALKAFGAPGKFLELIRIQDCSLPPPQEEKCVKKSKPDKVCGS